MCSHYPYQIPHNVCTTEELHSNHFPIKCLAQKASPREDLEPQRRWPTVRQTTSFLALPLELRQKIYSLTVDTSDDGIIVQRIQTGLSTSQLQVRGPRRSKLYPQLLRLSQQLRREATPMLYAGNFFFFDVETINFFLYHVRNNVQFLRAMTLDMGTPALQPVPLTPLLIQASGLKEFRLLVNYCDIGNDLRLTACIFTIMQYWLERIGELFEDRLAGLKLLKIEYDIFDPQDEEDDYLEQLRFEELLKKSLKQNLLAV